MDLATLIIAILSSSLLSSVLASFISIHLQRRKYLDEYYREVLRRRLDAYESLDRELLMLRTVSYDRDKNPFHAIFFSRDEFSRFIVGVGRCVASTIWFEPGTRDLVLQLNKLLVALQDAPNFDAECAVVGVRHYAQIVELRGKIDRSIHKDLLGLHRVSRFLKQGARREHHKWISSKDIFGASSGRDAGT